jgi:hypothetical protein
MIIHRAVAATIPTYTPIEEEGTRNPPRHPAPSSSLVAAATDPIPGLLGQTRHVAQPLAPPPPSMPISPLPYLAPNLSFFLAGVRHAAASHVGPASREIDDGVLSSIPPFSVGYSTTEGK